MLTLWKSSKKEQSSQKLDGWKTYSAGLFGPAVAKNIFIHSFYFHFISHLLSGEGGQKETQHAQCWKNISPNIWTWLFKGLQTDRIIKYIIITQIIQIISPASLKELSLKLGYVFCLLTVWSYLRNVNDIHWPLTSCAYKHHYTSRKVPCVTFHSCRMFQLLWEKYW